MFEKNSPSLYPSKLLLFGEHTVLQGSQALALPLWQYGGTWQYHADKSQQYTLPDFAQYLQDLQQKGQIDLDTEGLLRELDKGLYFDSNIPNGYGVGSSGALVAAIYTVFGINRVMRSRLDGDNLLQLKATLGFMEGYFHGASSGFDPLICYIKKPVLIKKDKTIHILEDIKNNIQFFLLDTKIQRKAQSLIQLFMEKSQTPQYKDLISHELVPYVDDAIEAFLQNESDILFDTVHHISHFQYRYFTEAIPLAFKNIWLEGLSNSIFKLKICGAGGGGFILGFTQDMPKTQHIFAQSGFKVIPLSPL
jgi:mevalonate kinase